MPRNFVSKKVLCPFYRNEKEQLIKCEGPIIGTSVHMVFGCKHDKNQFKDIYCSKNYSGCIYSRALSSFKYEEASDGK